MAALNVMTFGSETALCISSSSASARSHCPPFSHAEMAALKQITSGSTPELHLLLQKRERASTTRASHAEMAVL